MKNYIKQLLREGLINERLTEVDSDVNLLYDKFFKHDIDEINQTGIITRKMFNFSELDTSILQSEEAKKAHQMNPCKIEINKGNNHYAPLLKVISLSINGAAYDYVLNRYKGVLNDAIESLDDIPSQKRNLPIEFSEFRIKGSIHHELAHWIDDTMNKRHIRKRIRKQIASDTKDLNGIPVNSTKMEIQGQIHNIKQAYNTYKDIWDDISFYKLLSLVPTLNHVYNELRKDYKLKKQWVRDIKTRMAREGLLGKNMFY